MAYTKKKKNRLWVLDAENVVGHIGLSVADGVRG